MSPDFQTEEVTADKPAIGSPRWYAANLDYYRKGLERAIAISGEEYGVFRKDRQLRYCTPDGSGSTQLVSGIVGPFSSRPHTKSTDVAKLYWFWLRDSLVWAIEEFQAGRPLYAFRGLLQASGYAGKLEGLGAAAHDSHSSDAFGCLKNAIESVIGTKEGY